MVKPSQVKTPAPAPAKSELDQISESLATDAPIQTPSASSAAPATAPADESDMSGFTIDDCRDLSRSVWSEAFDELAAGAPYLKQPPEVLEKAVDRTAPVLYKYRDKMPEWFKLWREEIMLGMFLGSLAFGGWKAYRAEKARVEAERKKPQVIPTDAVKTQSPQPVADNVTRTA